IRERRARRAVGREELAESRSRGVGDVVDVERQRLSAGRTIFDEDVGKWEADIEVAVEFIGPEEGDPAIVEERNAISELARIAADVSVPQPAGKEAAPVARIARDG